MLTPDHTPKTQVTSCNRIAANNLCYLVMKRAILFFVIFLNQHFTCKRKDSNFSYIKIDLRI